MELKTFKAWNGNSQSNYDLKVNSDILSLICQLFLILLFYTVCYLSPVHQDCRTDAQTALEMFRIRYLGNFLRPLRKFSLKEKQVGFQVVSEAFHKGRTDIFIFPKAA